VRRLALVAVVLAAAGCGGGDDGLSEDDLATAQDMLSSSARVQRAVQPLYMCVPEDKRCYTKDGGTLVRVAQRERNRVDEALADADDECLKEVGGHYRDSLDAYAEAGRAAAEGKAAAFDAAVSRSTEAEIAFNRRLSECGFAQGRVGEVGAAMREVNIAVLRLSEKIAACTTERCVKQTAAQMEARAQEGMALLDELVSELRAEGGDDVPACLIDAIDLFRQGYVALEKTAVAVQAGDAQVAEREGTRAGRIEAQAQEDMAACLGTLD
jgi:hypothetical protein